MRLGLAWVRATPMIGNGNEENLWGAGGAGTAPAGRGELQGAPSEGLEVKVLFTTHAGTLAALRLVDHLGAQLGVRPVVLLFHAVPYALPLALSGICNEFFEERLRALAEEAPGEITARIYVCRNTRESMDQILPPHSLIVLGGRKGWRGNPERRIARRLAQAGREVIFAAGDR
jgi:hypothetical protein